MRQRQTSYTVPLTVPIDAVTLLCGGFGGARFAPGLLAAVGPHRARIVTNPGDDLRLGTAEIWPDFDSVLYSLAGIFDEDQGWGIRGDTYLESEAAGSWFRIGDRDLAMSRQRSVWLAEGKGRPEVARLCAEALGVHGVVVSASAEDHRTVIHTEAGEFGLQDYIVKRRARDRPLRVSLEPRCSVRNEEALALMDADLVVLGPSNPILSLMPILSAPAMASAISAAPRVVSVSPVVSNVPPRSVPESSRYRVREQTLEMAGIPHNPLGVAWFFAGLIDGFVIDTADEAFAELIEKQVGVPVLVIDLLRSTTTGRTKLAAEVVDFGCSLAPQKSRQTQGPWLSMCREWTSGGCD